MAEPRDTTATSLPSGDAEAIRHLKESIAAGKHWYIALLEAMGLWSSTEETRQGRAYRYLIGGEAFDWLLLAERLCEEVEGLIPKEEKDEILFHGRPPVNLSRTEVRRLIGSSKYRQYLNYFYGVTVETALQLETEEEVYKERQMLSLGRQVEVTDEAFRRIYEENRAALLKRFWKQRKRPQSRSTDLSELKEFTYWLFKYRLDKSEKARVASDTRKALDYLKRQKGRQGLPEALAADESGNGVSA